MWVQTDPLTSVATTAAALGLSLAWVLGAFQTEPAHVNASLELVTLLCNYYVGWHKPASYLTFRAKLALKA